MRIFVTDDPQKCGYRALKDELTITREESEFLKESAKRVKHSGKETARKTEREVYRRMTERYGRAVGGELLASMWMAFQWSDGKEI